MNVAEIEAGYHKYRCPITTKLAIDTVVITNHPNLGMREQAFSKTALELYLNEHEHRCYITGAKITAPEFRSIQPEVTIFLLQAENYLEQKGLNEDIKHDIQWSLRALRIWKNALVEDAEEKLRIVSDSPQEPSFTESSPRTSSDCSDSSQECFVSARFFKKPSQPPNSPSSSKPIIHSPQKPLCTTPPDLWLTYFSK